MCVGENRRTQHYAGNNPCLARSSSPRVLALPLLVWCPAVKSHYPFSLKPQASSSLGITAEARWAAQAAFLQIRRSGMDNKPFYWKKKTNQRNGKTLTRATVCPQHRGVAALLSWVLFSWWNALSEGLDDDRMLSAPGIVMWMQYFLHQVPNRKHEVKTFIWFL